MFCILDVSFCFSGNDSDQSLSLAQYTIFPFLLLDDLEVLLRLICFSDLQLPRQIRCWSVFCQEGAFSCCV